MCILIIAINLNFGTYFLLRAQKITRMVLSWQWVYMQDVSVTATKIALNYVHCAPAATRDWVSFGFGHDSVLTISDRLTALPHTILVGTRTIWLNSVAILPKGQTL